jgi:hypothetical protein
MSDSAKESVILFQIFKDICVLNLNIYILLYRLQLKNLFELDPSSVHLVSAKLGTGVKKLLDAVVKVFSATQL